MSRSPRSSLVLGPFEKLGLSRLEAAGFIGVTPTAFDVLVREGDMPPARRVGTVDRWDRRQIEAAFSNMPQADAVRAHNPYADVS